MNRRRISANYRVIRRMRIEGNLIRSTERMTGIHRDTIMRLLVQVGGGCALLMDREMRDLQSKRIQVDEIWAYVGRSSAT
ncbi:hypothetical protein [Mesorhizobium sp.]|uniref:hypothetical protein n=2 Tax=Mesorhizobium sp. TaxID=1871066 RepID=UPI000FE6C6FB|nr:hypothetical protein [Mesorhizobium sp.]RWI99968.1 MAG: hypothetical protein EOR23_31925 [Mesorhizobium sp.]RWM04965.1 MAG: hypothetical protein EOR71_25570 [Mesorhizobium sp.]RWO82161.1 MAG: hypothetical protein EOQ95_27610 [Mesorhizobium sp.]